MHQYRETLRVRQAVIEMGESHRPLSAIALALGYSSQSHFTNAFGRHFGLSPGALRAVLRGTSPPRFHRSGPARART